jgi:hypothetical protein
VCSFLLALVFSTRRENGVCPRKKLGREHDSPIVDLFSGAWRTPFLYEPLPALSTEKAGKIGYFSSISGEEMPLERYDTINKHL